MRKTLALLSLATAIPANAALIAEWRLDEGSGDIVDATGLHPAGTVVGSVAYGQPGVPAGTYGSITVAASTGSAIQFGPNVSDSFFQIGTDSLNPVMNIDRTASMTVMAWINPFQPDIGGRAYRPLSSGSSLGSDRGWGFALRLADTLGSASIRFTTYGIADNDSDPFNVAFGQWIHIAATYNNGAISYFLNGNLLGGSDVSLFGNEGTNSRLTVGGRVGGNDFDQTNGLLDGIRVYDEALTESQIRVAAAASVVPEPGVTLLAGIAAGLTLRRRRR